MTVNHIGLHKSFNDLELVLPDGDYGPLVGALREWKLGRLPTHGGQQRLHAKVLNKRKRVVRLARRPLLANVCRQQIEECPHLGRRQPARRVIDIER